MSSEKLASRSHRWQLPTGATAAIVVCASLVGCPKQDAHRRQATPSERAAPPQKAPQSSVLSDRNGAGVFAGSGPTGRPAIIWTAQLDGPIVHPLATDGTAVFAVSDGQVYCQEATGEARWRSRIGAMGPVAIVPQGVAVNTTDDRVLILDYERGLKVSEHPSGGPIVGAPLALGDDIVWVTESGQVISSTGWAVTASDSAVGGLSGDGSRVYFGTLTGEVVAVDKVGVQWRTVMPGPAVGRPAIRDGTLYAAYTGLEGQPGGVVAINAYDGEFRWRTPLDRDPATGPSVSHALLIPDRTGEMVGIDPISGDRLWIAPVEGDLITRPALTRFAAFGGNADGRLHRFDPDDGGEAWSIQLGATASADPVVIGNTIIIGLADGTLIAVGGQ